MAKRHYMFLLLVCVMGIFLVASASASDLNENSLTEIDANDIGIISASDDDEIDGMEHDLRVISVDTNDTEKVSASDDEIEGVENLDVLSTDASTYSQLSDEIGSGGNIELKHDYYTYDNGSTISITITNSVIDGKGAIIDMAGSSIRALSVNASGVTIKNLIIKNANFKGDGGAVYFSSSGTIESCSFIGNSAQHGGAVYFSSSGTIEKCTFYNNLATDASYGGGAILFSGTGTVTNCNFTGNYASWGGSIRFNGDGNVTNCNFTGNSARFTGGAVYFGSLGTTKTVTNCNFTNNHANSHEGGAIYFYNNGEVTNCNFVNNKATSSYYDTYGGAIYFGGNSISSVLNCNFTDNTASKDGGAVYFTKGGNVENCNFINNTVSNSGGAIFYKSGRGTLINCNFNNNTASNGGAVCIGEGTVENCNFNNNTASNGGAIRCGGLATVEHCNFNNNTASEGGAIWISGGAVTNCNFVNNSASSNGGAVHYTSSSLPHTVTNCNFINNKAARGGAIYFSSGGSVVNCNLTNNKATSGVGGAIFTIQGNVENCNFINNSASSDGGAVYCAVSYGFFTFTNCNFINNIASNGGAVYFRIISSSTTFYYTVTNCNFTNNQATTGRGGAVYSDNYECAQIIYLTNCNLINSVDKNGKNCGLDASELSSGGFNIMDCLFDVFPTNMPYHFTSILEVNNLSIVLGDDGILVVNLSDLRGPLVNTNITLTINGKEYFMHTDASGHFSINVNDYLSESGIYNFNFYFAGDNINNPVSVNSTVIVRYDSALLVNNLSIAKGNDGILVANLSDSRGPLVNKTIIFTINGNNYTNTTNSEGISKINIKDILTESGIYIVDVICEKDYLNNPVCATSTVIVRYDSVLNANNLSVFITEDGILTADLSDARGPLVNKNIIFTVNGNNYINTTDSNGLSSINVKNYLTSSGSYTVYIDFNGDDYDNPTSASANVIINKYDSIINPDDLSVYITQDAILSVKLSNPRGVLKNRNIKFTINGNINSATTNSQGIATLNIKNYLNQADTYTVGVSFEGDNENNPSSANATVIVNKYESSIALSPISVYIGADGILSAALSDARGSLANKVLTFTVNGADYTNTTDSNGVARFNVKNYLTQANTYIVKVSFAEDDYDKSTSTNVNVVINKYSPTLTVNDLSVHKGEDGIITAKFSDLRGNLSNKEITFTIEGNKYTNTTNSEGIATVNVKNYLTDSGSYTVGVSFAGDDEDKAVSRNSNVIVRYDSLLNAENISLALGEDGNLIASLSDVRGALSGKKLIFTVNNIQRTVNTNGYGLAALSIRGLLTSSGEYTVNIAFEGDNYNNPVFLNASVIIRYDVNLDAREANIYKGEEGNISVVLSDARGVLANRNVTFNINNENHTILTDSEGRALIKVTDYLSSAGNHIISVSFAGDEFDNPIAVNVSVVIKKYDSILNVEDLVVYVGELGNLVANLSDLRGPLVNKVVTFTVNNVEYNFSTDSRGLASFDVNRYLNDGEYSIGVGFAGDEFDKPASSTVNVVINKYDSVLIVEDLVIHVGEQNNLVANLSDLRGPLTNKVITFTVNGVAYNISTDSKGLASFEVNKYLTDGKYFVDVTFKGDEFDKPSSAIVNVTINKYDSTLTADDLNIFKDGNVSLAAYLSDIRGALSNKTVVFTVDDVDYNVTTDLNGIAYFGVTKYLSEGKYGVTINFAGDEFDKPSTTTVNVTINRYDSVLTANNLVIFKDESDCVIANLSDIRGPLAGKKIFFMVNSVKFDVTTNSSGLASFDINSYLDEGNYTLYISFAGDEFDKPASTNVTVILKKYDSILIVNDLSMVVGDGDLLVANLSNIRGPISKKSIIFTVNNQNIARTTSSLGIASLKISDYLQTVGKYTVRVSFAGDDANDPVSVNASVLISNYKGNLSVVQKGKYYGDTSLTFKLVDLKNNNPVGYASINVAFSNGRTVSLTTDSNGLANYVVPFEPGTYNFTAGVTSPNVDVNTLEITNLTINKIVGEIQITHEDYSKTLKIKLANPQNGDVYRNILVTLEFSNGEVVPVTTNDEGIFVYEMPFTPDTYYVIASVTGDYMEFEVAELDNIIISDKDNSIIKIYDDIIFDYGKSGSTTISVINGRVLQENIAVIDHPEANITLNNNEIIVSNLTVGTYTLRVVTTPDEGYNAVVGTKHIIVNGIYSSVDIHNNIEFDYSKSGSTTVDVEGGRIGNVTIDGNPHGAVINLTGNMITVSGLDAGTYTLRVTSSPDANHKSVDGTAYINVRKINGEVNISDMVFDYGQSGYTTVYVEGGSIDQFNIKIIGHEDIVPQLNGNILTVSGLDADTYVLSVTSTPDRNHYPATGQANIVVNRVKSSVELSGNISFDYLGSNSIFALVSGGVVEYDNITIDGNPKEAKITFDNNIISISGLNAGTYTLRVKSSPDKNHLADEQTAMITVNRIASSISFGSKSIVFDYLKSGSVTVAVVGGNVLESGLSVVDHPEVKPTIKDNRITLSGLNVGMYTLRVENAPNGNYRSDVKFINITVNKVSAAIKVKAIALYYKEGKKWTIKLIDTKTGKGIANMVIKLKVFTGKKSKTYSVKTNSKGVATFKNLKKLSVGKHKVTLSFSKYGYNCKSVSKTVKVLKQTKVEYTVKSVPRKDGTSVSIWIKTGKKPIKKGVKFNIYVPKRKKPVTVVTGTFNKVNKGFVGYGTNLLSAGTHKITIKPVGFKYKGSKTIKIKIKKGVNKYKKSETIISKGKLQTILN